MEIGPNLNLLIIKLKTPIQGIGIDERNAQKQKKEREEVLSKRGYVL